MSWLTFGAIIASVGVGLLAFARFGATGGTLRDAIAVLRNGFFVISGVFLILGGYVIPGFLIVVLFVFLGAGAASSVWSDNLRGLIAPDS